MIRAWTLFACLCSLTACPGPGSTPTPNPSREPEDAPVVTQPSAGGTLETTGDTLRTGTSLVNRQLVVKVSPPPGSSLPERVHVELAGPTLARGTASRAGSVTFGWLEPGSYRVRVEASGYPTRVVDFELAGSPGSCEVLLEGSDRRITGLVTSDGGVPLGGAWVSCGAAGGWTNSEGRFDLPGVTRGASTVEFHRGGFQNQGVPLLAGADRDVGTVALATGSRRISWENPEQPLRLKADGSIETVSEALKSLASSLSTAGWAPGDRLAEAEVRVVVAPSDGILDLGTCARLQAFARAGGTLVVTGEWGGAGFHAPEAIARLLHPLGLGVLPSLVRVPGSGGRLDDFRSTPSAGSFLAAGGATREVRSVTSASLWCPAQALVVLSAPATGYRISASSMTGEVLVAANHVEKGRVIVTGDTSAWLGGLEGGEGASWDNLSFVRTLITW